MQFHDDIEIVLDAAYDLLSWLFFPERKSDTQCLRFHIQISYYGMPLKQWKLNHFAAIHCCPASLKWCGMRTSSSQPIRRNRLLSFISLFLFICRFSCIWCRHILSLRSQFLFSYFIWMPQEILQTNWIGMREETKKRAHTNRYKIQNGLEFTFPIRMHA